MNNNYLKPVGTQDLFGDVWSINENVFNIINNYRMKSCFQMIETPIFENKALFARDYLSEIVNKELYVFKDKGNRELALRPEMTASVARAILENKLLMPNEKKQLRFSYYAPVFRYERPQFNRYRQFRQYGFEIINSSLSDIFIVLTDIKNILNDLNIANYTLEINYLPKDTLQYCVDLSNYFKENNYDIGNRNVLRILDDKLALDLVKNAPSITNYLNSRERDRWNKILNTLNELNISYTINKNLVRGLDYYSGFVFEIKIDNLAFCGGGEYDNLFAIISKMMGYKQPISASCFGYAFGFERLVSLYMKNNQLNTSSKFANLFINLSDDEITGLKLTEKLKKNNQIMCIQAKSLKEAFKIAKWQFDRLIIYDNDKQIKIKSQNNNLEQVISLDEFEKGLNDKNLMF